MNNAIKLSYTMARSLGIFDKKKNMKCKICYKMRWFSGKRRFAISHPLATTVLYWKVCNWIKLIILMTLMKCLITDGGVFLFGFSFFCVIPLNEDRSHVSQHCVYTFFFYIFIFGWPPEGGVNVIFYILPLIYFNIKQFPPLSGKTESNSTFLLCWMRCRFIFLQP